MPSRGRARRLGLGTAVVCCLVLSACWPQYRQNPDRTGHNTYESTLTTASVADLTEAWRVPAGSPAAFVDGDVLAVSGGDLRRLDLATGAVEWTWTSPPDALGPTTQEPAVVGAGAVLATWYVYQAGGFWHSRGQALDPATGAPVAGWDRGVAALRLPLVVTEAPCAGAACLLPGFAVHDTTTSDVVVSAPNPLDSLTLGDGVLYGGGAALAGGLAVVALPVDEGAPMCAPAGYPDADVFVCPLWETPIEGKATPVVIDPSGDVVYAGTDAGVVSAFDAASGGLLWSTPVDGAVVHEPALADGVLYVGTANGRLEALDAASGGPLWSAAVGAGEVASPPSVGGTGAAAVVYAATTGGDVAALPAGGCAAPTCDPLWSGDAGAGVVAGPLVAHGALVVGVDAGVEGEVVVYRPA